MPVPMSEFLRFGMIFSAHLAGVLRDRRLHLSRAHVVVSEPPARPRRVHEATRTRKAGA